MKNLFIICMLVLFLCLLAGATFADSFRFDFNSDEIWDTECTLDPTINETVQMDIWIADYSPTTDMFGTLFYLHSDNTKVQVNMGNSSIDNTCWDSSFNTLVDLGGGVISIASANLSCCPVSGGSIKIATIELECIGAGDSNITAAFDVGVSPVGSATDCDSIDFPVSDAVATIHQPECEIDAECNDQNVCTTDTCEYGLCVNTAVPNGTSCDDGLYCNGTETCEEGVCESGTIPCPDDGNPCTDDCDEVATTCYVCNATGYSDTCCSDSACIGEDICKIVITDYYVDGTNGSNADDGLTPGFAWKTITYALNQVPLLMVLDENNRALIHVAVSIYDTVMGGEDAETFPLNMVEYVSLEGAGYHVTIINAEKTNQSGGGVIKCDHVNDITIDGFTITGGMGIRGGVEFRYSSPTISNCKITGNEAWINGGGVWCKQSLATIANCIISENTAGQNGGGIACGDYSSPTITSCTIADNQSGDGLEEGGGALYCGDESSPAVTNCILWDNYPNEIYTKDGAAPVVTYNCIEGGYSGTGNAATDPNFFWTTYHLMYGSLCIDSGNSNGALDTDIYGNVRYDDCATTPNTGTGPYDYYDRGAIEYQGDSDFDGILDDADESCTVGDNPCTAGQTAGCDDNCTFMWNPNQEDIELDGVGDVCDNCLETPNGPILGTCVRTISSMVCTTGTTCTLGTCGSGETCDISQGDSNVNGIGDACECYADINCDGFVEFNDLKIIKPEYNRDDCSPGNPCYADLNGDGFVQFQDLKIMKFEYNRDDCPIRTGSPPCAP